MIDITAEPAMALLGWNADFDVAEILNPLREIDKWLRRRLRCCEWKQCWLPGVAQTRRRGAENLEYQQIRAQPVATFENPDSHLGVAGENIQQYGAARLA